MTEARRILLERLTDREIEILDLTGDLTSKRIANNLGISPGTVDNYISSAIRKLGVSNRSEARAILQGVEIEGLPGSADARKGHRSPPNPRSIPYLTPYDLGGSEPRPSARAIPRTSPNAFTIVETLLFPRNGALRWAMHATYAPGDTNTAPEDDFEEQILTLKTAEPIRVGSLRELAILLLQQDISNDQEGYQLPDDIEESIAWIRALPSDEELFVSDGVIIHSSPPSWIHLEKLFSASASSGIAGVIVFSDSAWHAAMIVVGIGGGRIVLRLARNINFLQDAFFERLSEKIRKGSADDSDIDRLT